VSILAKNFPLSEVQRLCQQYDKSAVIICAADAETRKRVDVTSFGVDAVAKQWAAEGGERCVQALGITLREFSDFRQDLDRALLREALDLLTELTEGLRTSEEEFLARIRNLLVQSKKPKS
jgi:hypothetical protein